MKTSTRYLLILFGIFVFFIVAPILVLYVSGTRVHLDSRDTSSTGILDAKSEPTGAKVFINGVERDTTPATIRFLAQGEYDVVIKKEGYRDWSKRLAIEAGEVRFAQEGVEVVQLIKNSEPEVIEPAGISNFVLVNDTIWYAKGNDVIYASVNNPEDKTVLPGIFKSPSALVLLRDHKHILVSNQQNNGDAILINTSAKAVSVLPFSVQHDYQVNMPSDDVILYQNSDVVYSYNIIAKNTVKVKENVRTFSVLGSTAYFGLEDGRITTEIWNGSTFNDEQTIAEQTIFDETTAELVITDRKELFLNNGNKGLYRVGPELTQVVPRVDKVHLDTSTNELTFEVAGEQWFYNFLTSKPQLLTRSTDPVYGLMVRSSIGYGFVASKSGFEVVEIDTRDKQNRYQLLSGKPVYQLGITEDQRVVVVLEDGSIKTIELRD